MEMSNHRLQIQLESRKRAEATCGGQGLSKGIGRQGRGGFMLQQEMDEFGEKAHYWR